MPIQDELFESEVPAPRTVRQSLRETDHQKASEKNPHLAAKPPAAKPSVKIFQVNTKLARTALNNGGVTIEQVTARVGQSLAALAPEGLAALDRVLAEMDTRFGRETLSRETLNRDNEPTEELLGLCTQMMDLSVFSPNLSLQTAIESFYHLTGLMQSSHKWNWELVYIYLDALRLLRMPPEQFGAEERMGLIHGLARVTAKRFGAASLSVTRPLDVGPAAKRMSDGVERVSRG